MKMNRLTYAAGTVEAYVKLIVALMMQAFVLYFTFDLIKTIVKHGMEYLRSLQGIKQKMRKRHKTLFRNIFVELRQEHAERDMCELTTAALTQLASEQFHELSKELINQKVKDLVDPLLLPDDPAQVEETLKEANQTVLVNRKELFNRLIDAVETKEVMGIAVRVSHLEHC